MLFGLLVVVTASGLGHRPPPPALANELLSYAIGGVAFALAFFFVPSGVLRWAVALSAVFVAATVVLDAEGLVFAARVRRPGGVLDNRSYAGQYLALSTPLALATLGAGPGCWLMLPLGLALGLTRSRTGWLAAATGAALLIGLSKRPARRRVAVGAGLLLAGALAAPWLPARLSWTEANPYRSSLERLAEVDQGSGELRVRQYAVAAGVLSARRAWLSGFGPARWRPLMLGYEPALAENAVPHSDYLRMLMDAGLPALVLLVTLFAGGLLRAWEQRAERPAELAALAVMVSLCAGDAVLDRSEAAVAMSALLGTLSRLASAPTEAAAVRAVASAARADVPGRSFLVRRIVAAVSAISVVLLGLSILTTRGCARGSRRVALLAQRARMASNWELTTFPNFGPQGMVAYEDWNQPNALFVVSALSGNPVPRRVNVPEKYPFQPALSPDGRFIAYGRTEFSPLETLRYERVLLDLDTGRRTQLLPHHDGESRWNFIWLDGGRSLLHRRGWTDDGGRARLELRLLDIATGAERVLLDDAQFAPLAPAVSPDGRFLAITSPPDVWLVPVDGSSPRRLYAAPTAQNEFAPQSINPDPPAWSPDGSQVAFSVRTSDCFRVMVTDVATGASRWLDENECAFRPVWSPSGHDIAYLRLGLSEWTPWARSARGDGAAQPLGLRDGITHRISFASEDTVLLVGRPTGGTMGLWRLDRRRPTDPELLASSFQPPLDPAWVGRPEVITFASADGLQVPLAILPRTCGRADRPGPAVVVVHGGPGVDYGPRFYPHLAALTSAGASVFAVNFRGSTGNGARFKALGDDLEGQIADVVGAIEHVARRPDVDPRNIFLQVESYGATIGYAALARTSVPFRGVIETYGVRGRADANLRKGTAAIHLAVAQFDAPERVKATRSLVKELRSLGHSVNYLEYPLGHPPRFAPEQGRMALDVAAFVESLSGSCVPE